MSLEELSQKLGVPADRLPVALRSYQQQIGAATSGRPNPPTLAALELYDPLDEAPRSFEREREGKKPGTLGRDFTTSLNQIPRWVYVLLSVGSFGMAYWIYRSARKR